MRKKQNYQWNHLTMGTCYYPEQWDQSLWKDDLKRMKDNGIEVIRIGEFAWSKIEPREGEFSFEFFDSFLDVAEKMDMKVIFGTPTATPPAWLTEKYPEVLNCQKDGTLFRHGMRRHVNYNSQKWYELSKIIVEQVAKHYGKRSCIVGWQLDNEINCEVNEYYSESDTCAFREFLKNKYQTLDKLNKAWGTVFWNQTYTDWKEIYVPRTTVNGSINPHQKLDYLRFVSDTVNRYFKMQSDIIRKYKKETDYVTTNGMFINVNNHQVIDDSLDVYTYDSYPNFAMIVGRDLEKANDLNDRKKSQNLMEVRSVCPHFGIMEQQSGANGWTCTSLAPSPKPGQMMLWTMQSIGHGADFINFFRWRTATQGTEIYWHGLLDYNNKDNRKIAELQKINKRMKAINEISGADFKASFAMIRDYDNIWDAQLDIWHNHLTAGSELEIFIASQLNHTPMDSLYLLDSTDVDDLKKYPVIIAPHQLLMNEKQANILKEYVRDGGCLIIGARTGLKDKTGACVMTSTPGLLADMTQTEVHDFTIVGPADGKVYMDWNGQKLDTGTFNEVITVNGNAKVLATYVNNYYASQAALTETQYGKGKVLHFGGTFTRENVKALFEYLQINEAEKDVIQLPKECEIIIREKEGNKYCFVLNYDKQPQQIILKTAFIDMDINKNVQGEITLAPYETKVYKYI